MEKEVIVSLEQILKTIEVCSLSGFLSLSDIIRRTQIKIEDYDKIIEAWKNRYTFLQQLKKFENLNDSQREEFVSCYECVLEFLKTKKQDSV